MFCFSRQFSCDTIRCPWVHSSLFIMIGTKAKHPTSAFRADETSLLEVQNRTCLTLSIFSKALPAAGCVAGDIETYLMKRCQINESGKEKLRLAETLIRISSLSPIQNKEEEIRAQRLSSSLGLISLVLPHFQNLRSPLWRDHIASLGHWGFWFRVPRVYGEAPVCGIGHFLLYIQQPHQLSSGRSLSFWISLTEVGCGAAEGGWLPVPGPEGCSGSVLPPAKPEVAEAL